MPLLSSSSSSSFSLATIFKKEKKDKKEAKKQGKDRAAVTSGGGRVKRSSRVGAPPPVVSARESSLYKGHVAVSDFTQQHHHQQHHYDTYNDTLYNLEANPSAFFPTPPPRLSLQWDKRHTDIWDDLFDWAETYKSSSVYSSASSSATSHSTSQRSRLTCQTQLDLSSTGELAEKKKKRLSGLFSLGRLGLRSEIWSKSDMSDMTSTASSAPVTAPSVPPRSRLRAQAPPPLTSRSTSYLLPVDEPLPPTPETPVFSSSYSTEASSPQYQPVSPGQDTVTFGRKKKSQAALGKDPLKIRDGAESRRSTSGVYTPPTFPGAQGPRPSHFPSHVYTPTNFNLHNPAPPRSTPHSYSNHGAGPSRSASISSSESDGPSTPATTHSRLSTFSGRAMTGFKRISHQITSTNTPPPIKQPLSARDSYFPSSIGADVTRVYESPSIPSTPRPIPISPGFSVSSPVSPYGSGLGVGLAEHDGQTTRLSPKSGSILFSESAVDLSAGSKTSPQAKGKRKPVPRMLDDQLANKMDNLRVEETHAL